MPKLIILISAILLVLLTSAQPPKQYSFTHYTTNAGLLSNQVNAVVQDAEGYIWAGTTDGLQRFDGTRYKTFRYNENDSNGLPSNPVWQLLLDKKKNLWVLMSDGKVGIFDTHRFIYKIVPTHFKKPVTPNTSLKHLISDEFGNVYYLLSGSEVITYSEKAHEFSYSHNFFKNSENWDIIDFVQQPGTNKYWLSISKTGLAIYDRANDVISYPQFNSKNEEYNHLLFDKRQYIWVSTGAETPYIQCYDLRSNQQLVKDLTLSNSPKTSYAIKSFFQQTDGSIWVNGLQVFAKFNEKEKQFQPVYNGYLNEQSIAYEMVHCLFEDREKNIWVGTDNNGLYRFNPATEFFNNVKHTDRSKISSGRANVMSFVATKWGNVLATTWGDGLYEYDKDFNQVPTTIIGAHKIDQYLNCMFALADSNAIWMSAQQGLYVIDQQQKTFKYFNPPQFKKSTISEIAEDKKGNIWLGMNNAGVFKWTPGTARKKFEEGITAFSAIPPLQINKLMVDSKGYIWVGTPENGVFVIDPDGEKVVTRFTDTSQNEKKLPDRGVSDILEYNDSLLIITTATHVFCYNRVLNKSRVIGSAGTISGFITALQMDRAGDLWLTSTSGLYSIDIKKNVFTIFGRADGIDNEHFIQSASYKLSDGRMLFGTTNDIIVFDPAKIKIISATPDIQITDIKIMGKYQSLDSLMNLEQIDLNYKDNALAIEFSPLTYNSPSFITYKLDGLEKTWKSSDKNNEAIYSYLPPGNYTFLIKAINEEGKESPQITQVKINVSPPFWKTWWFYSLLLLTAATFFYWYDRERMKRKEAVQKIRSEIADNLYQEVNTTLGNINILSEMAKLKADKDPAKSKDYIQQINAKSQQMIVSMDDMLWGISPENDSMQKTIERFKEHIDMLRNRYQVQIDLLVDKKVEELKLNMKVRQNVFWFLKNGSTNMVKAGATKVKLLLTIEKQQLLYTLEFDHTYADMQQLNNILQRQELAKKVAETDARLTIQHQTSISLIQLTIPL